MIDSMPDIQSSPCGTGTCAPSANTHDQVPTTRGSHAVDTVEISKQEDSADEMSPNIDPAANPKG